MPIANAFTKLLRRLFWMRAGARPRGIPVGIQLALRTRCCGGGRAASHAVTYWLRAPEVNDQMSMRDIRLSKYRLHDCYIYMKPPCDLRDAGRHKRGRGSCHATSPTKLTLRGGSCRRGGLGRDQLVTDNAKDAGERSTQSFQASFWILQTIWVSIMLDIY